MTDTKAQAFPLAWPFGWPRTPSAKRQPTRFHSTRHESYRHRTSLSVSDAVGRLITELRALGVRSDDMLLSTNVRPRLDGWPRSDERMPDDPGAAVYFKLKGKDRVLACDRWATVAGNIAAIAAHVGALRGMDRWGVGSVEQAFAGYAALPAPGDRAKRDWREVLRPGAPSAQEWTPYIAESAYKVLLRERHPDRGGTQEQAAELNAAIEEARKYFNQQKG